MMHADGRMVAAGTDEAGRGPLAGPVVAAAVILTAEQRKYLLSKGLKDSKKLSPPKRETLFEMICESGVRRVFQWSVWRATARRFRQRKHGCGGPSRRQTGEGDVTMRWPSTAPDYSVRAFRGLPLHLTSAQSQGSGHRAVWVRTTLRKRRRGWRWRPT